MKISDLASATALLGTEVLPVTQGGSTVKATVNQLKAAVDSTVTLTGDVTGTGPGSLVTTLASIGTSGTYQSVTTDSKGRVISGTNEIIQFQNNGIDLGAKDVGTVNFTGAIIGTRSAGTVTVSSTRMPIGWNEKTADYTLVPTDAGNGIAMDVSIPNTITLSTDDQLNIPIGTSILIYQEGTGQTTILPVFGVTLRVRTGFTAVTDGQFAIISLIKRAENEWVIAGDLEAA